MIKVETDIIHVTKWPDENRYSAYFPLSIQEEIPFKAVGIGKTVGQALRSLADAIDLLNDGK